MKNFSKIALLTVLSFLTTSQVFAETPEEIAARLAAAAPAVAKTDPTPLPAETLAKPIDDPKLTEVAPPAEPKKEEDKVVPASVAPEKNELAAPAAPTKSSWTVKSVLSGAISSVKGLFTSKSTPEVKKEEPKPTTADPAEKEAKPTDPIPVTEKELVASPVEPAVKTTEPLTEEQKKFLVASPFKPSSALAAAAGIRPPVAPGLGAALQEGFDDAKSAWRDKQTLKKETEQKDIDVESKKPLDITVEDTPDEKPASPKEIEAATAEIKATANPTMEAEENIRKYWQEKNSSKRKEKIAATAAISFLTGGIIGVTVVLPFLLRSLAKQLDKAEEEHLKKLQAEALGAQAKLDALGKEATTLDKLMVGQLGLNPDRLYPESDFNRTRGKEDERPTFTKLFRLLDNDPQKFLDAVEILREKEVAGLLTPREKEQLGIIRNLKPEDIEPLGFFGSIAKYFGFPNKNETLEKIKSSWEKKYSSEEIAKLKEKHGAKTTTSEPAKKVEDDQKLKTTPPAEEPVDAAKKPKTPEELASETAAKKQSLLDSGYSEQAVEKMLSQEAINQTSKKKGTIIPEMATLDQIIQPTKTVTPVLPETEKKEKTPPPPATAPQSEKITDPLESEEIKQLSPPPSTAAASVKRDKKIGSSTPAPTELTEEVEKDLPEPVKTVPLPEETKIIVPTEDASTVSAKAPNLVAASPEKTLDQTKVPPPVPVEPKKELVVPEKNPPLIEEERQSTPTPVTASLVEPSKVALTTKEKERLTPEQSLLALKKQLVVEEEAQKTENLKTPEQVAKEILEKQKQARVAEFEKIKAMTVKDAQLKDAELGTPLPTPTAIEQKKTQEPASSDQKLKDNPTPPTAAQNPPKIVVIDKTADDEAEITPMAKRPTSTPKKQPGGKELALSEIPKELGSETEGYKQTPSIEESDQFKLIKADEAEIQKARADVVKINEETKQKLADNLAEQERLKKLIETAQADLAKKAELEGKIAEIEKDKKDLDETLKDVEKVEETFKGTEVKRKELLEKLEAPQKKLDEIAIERENAVAEITGMKELNAEIEKTRNDMRTARPEEKIKLQSQLGVLNKTRAERINENEIIKEIDKKFAKQQDRLTAFNRDAETFRMVTELNDLNNPIKKALDVVVRPELKRLRTKMDKMAEEKKIKKAQEEAEKLKNQANIKAIDDKLAEKQAVLDQKLLQQAKITEEAQKNQLLKSRKDSGISRALSYGGDRPDQNNDFDLRLPVSDNIWKLAQQSKTQGLFQTSLTDPAQSMPTQFMSRRSERPAPLPPPSDDWTKPNPEVEHLTQSVGFGFGSQDLVAKKAESIATAKRLSSQTTTLLEQKREINPPLPPTSLLSPSSPRSPQQFYSHTSPTSQFMIGSPADVNKAWSQVPQQPSSQELQSSAVIRPEEIQQVVNPNPLQKTGRFKKSGQ